jgi:hypothetical protein
LSASVSLLKSRRLLPDFTPPSARDDHDRKLLADVTRVGWHVLNILEDDQGPAYSFSIGLYYSFQKPEILVMGLRHEVAHRLINICGEHYTAGKMFKPFERIPDVVERFDCGFAPIRHVHYENYLGYANWFYRSLSQPFPVLQLVWPDKSGKLPWENGADPKLLKLQKPLWST